MALATAKAAPLRPDIKLSQALSGFVAILSADQKQSYNKSPPDANAVMALTCEIDRQNAGRRTRRSGARLTSFLNSVKDFTSIVDLIVSSTGNPIAGGVWGAVKVAIQAALGFETYFDSLSTFLMNVGLSAPRFEKYELLYPTSKSLQKGLCNYYAVVINLCTKIVLFVRKPFIKQIASALRKPFEDEFGSFQKDLNRLGMEVKEEVSLASKQLQSLDSIEAAQERKQNSVFRTTATIFRRDIANEFEQAKKWRQQRAKAQFLNSCSKYNFETTLNQARKQGASTWIFQNEEYRQWASSTSSSTLLCSGIVGAGKTVLCANVVEDLVINKSQSSSLGYFFCRSDDTASLKAREILGSLSRQFFEDLPSDELNISQMGRDLGGLIPDINQILSKLTVFLPRHKHYIMVIDGLDECEYDEVGALVAAIQSLLKSPGHIFKLFWTGRSDFASRVSEQLPPNFHVQISPSDNGREISRYIELALVDALESNRLKLRDPSIVLKIQDALESEANEMFLWVVFQIDSICTQNTDHDIINSLKNLPKGLPETFRRILHRLQQSAFANPSLGQKIFEIVAAAQRPLTLDELGEAISITPGDTSWDGSKLVNDVLRSLESCGSFIVVDEELSTVHFAHSSVKQHLLSEPTDLDVRDYHTDALQADINLGKIVVTYLNLDVLGNQLSKTSPPSQRASSHKHAADVPSFVVRSALPKRELVNKMALAILRGRKVPDDSGTDFERSADFLQEINAQKHEAFTFLPYCQEYWLYHSKKFYTGLERVYHLWRDLVYGRMRTVELPWAPEHVTDLGERLHSWITLKKHDALIRTAIEEICSPDFFVAPYPFLGQLEHFLSLLPNEDAMPTLAWIPVHRRDGLPQQAASHGYEMIVRLALREFADVNEENDLYGNALHETLSNRRRRVAELLIERGAEVNPLNRQGWEHRRYANALQACAATLGTNPIIELLLEKGADVNALGGRHGTALTAAASSGNVGALRLLLKAGADVNAHDGNVTALVAAVADSKPAAVSILLEAGADVNYPNSNVETPLRAAARVQNEYIVEQLLEKGAIVDTQLENVEEYMVVFKTNRSIAMLLHEYGWLPTNSREDSDEDQPL